MRALIGLLLSVSMISVWATSLDDLLLVRKDYQLYQLWSLGRNYFFGATLKPNPIKALAYQRMYVDLLPASYPKKAQLLAPYQQGLTVEQMNQAYQLATRLITKHHLSALTDVELARAYQLRDESNSWHLFEPALLAPAAVMSHFNQWLQWLDAHNEHDNALHLDQYAYRLLQAKQLPIVYGQVVVQGPETEDRITSDVKILPGGFFVGHPNTSVLSFALPGYKTVTVPINTRQTIQALPVIKLTAIPCNQHTGVIGRVLPWAGLESGNIILRSERVNAQTNPWQQTVLPLTVTNSGEFYTTGLAAGGYQLIINAGNMKMVVKFRVKDGEVRGLSLIDLRHSVKQS